MDSGQDEREAGQTQLAEGELMHTQKIKCDSDLGHSAKTSHRQNKDFYHCAQKEHTLHVGHWPLHQLVAMDKYRKNSTAIVEPQLFTHQFYQTKEFWKTISF
jgi:hypothetical protein